LGAALAVVLFLAPNFEAFAQVCAYGNGTANASNNRVNITDGSVGGAPGNDGHRIIGGNASCAKGHSIASGNTVSVIGGTVEHLSIDGGSADIASDNTVEIGELVKMLAYTVALGIRVAPLPTTPSSSAKAA